MIGSYVSLLYKVESRNSESKTRTFQRKMILRLLKIKTSKSSILDYERVIGPGKCFYHIYIFKFPERKHEHNSSAPSVMQPCNLL